MKLYLGMFLFGCQRLPKHQEEMTYQTVQEIESTTYRIVSDNVSVSSGVVGFGNNCDEASQSSGFTTTTETKEILSTHTLVGATYIDNIDKEKMKDMIALLYQKTETETGTYSEITTYSENDFDYENDDIVWNTYSLEKFQEDVINTEASWYGITHDDYVLRFSMDQFWTPAGSEIITKYEPKKGDFWTSNGGRTLHIYDGEVEITIGDKDVKGDKILLYEALNTQSDGSNVVSDCLHTRSDQTAYEDEDLLDSDLIRISIDEGCEDNFIHVKTGEQIWYEDMLYSEDVQYREIEILDYGFERYVLEENYSDREEKRTIDAIEESEWTQFIEYRIEQISSVTTLESYEEIK